MYAAPCNTALHGERRRDSRHGQRKAGLEYGMIIVAWILVGLVFGAVAGQAASRANLGVFGNIALAMTSAVLAGAFADLWAGGIEVTRLQLGSTFTAMTAGVIVLVTHDQHERLHARSVGRTP
jgi:uncharacterized membrane protein YeaQ/YmgE (transglycosylase-associated protein family)